MSSARVHAHVMADDGRIPNSHLPLLIYPRVFVLSEPDPPGAIEATLRRNGWECAWRNGIYPFHHYHGTAHEALAVYSGSARVQFGGERGIVAAVDAGDVVVIPAGVGHKNLEASTEFRVIGAYPRGSAWDLCYGRPEERPQADANIARVPMPAADPVFGRKGPLLSHWRRAGRRGIPSPGDDRGGPVSPDQAEEA